MRACPEARSGTGEPGPPLEVRSCRTSFVRCDQPGIGHRADKSGTHAVVDTLLGFLAAAVFGLLWLAHQEWFDFLPRSVTRTATKVTAAVLVATCLFAPSAFRAGFLRFTDYLAKSITSQMQQVLDRIGSTLPTAPPSPGPSSTPTRVR